MKIAVSSIGMALDSKMSETFGRCPYFIVAETKGSDIMKTELVENAGVDQKSGAGISAAEAIAEKGVKVVITDNIGPRAADIFKQFKIKVYEGKGTIREAINKFTKGELKKII